MLRKNMVSLKCFGSFLILQTHNYNKLHFFEHSGLYWQPASTKAGLYSQLAAKKYREIPRADVK